MKISTENIVIKTTPKDNVGIICNTFGLKKGEIVLENILLKQDIPLGHKVALAELNIGDSIIRYGEIIGFANTKIEAGEWVNENKLEMPEAPILENIPYINCPPPPDGGVLNGYTFLGYKNPDGSVGTKNILGITISVQCVAGITNFITKKIKEELLPKYSNVNDVVAFNHTYGCGVAINAPAAIIPIRTIKNIAQARLSFAQTGSGRVISALINCLIKFLFKNIVVNKSAAAKAQ